MEYSRRVTEKYLCKINDDSVQLPPVGLSSYLHSLPAAGYTRQRCHGTKYFFTLHHLRRPKRYYQGIFTTKYYDGGNLIVAVAAAACPT